MCSVESEYRNAKVKVNVGRWAQGLNIIDEVRGRACDTGLTGQRESEERAKSVCKGHGLRNVMYIRRDLIQALGGLPVAATMILRP